MRVLLGASFDTDAEKAVVQATQGWSETPEILFVFSSTQQDPVQVARCLSNRFPHTPMVGCSTAGEHLNGEHFRGSLVLSGLVESGVRWQTALIDDLEAFDRDVAEKRVEDLFEGFSIQRESFDPRNYFCLLFVDGLSGQEEKVIASLADALEGIEIAGGSAGDDLAFRETFVYHNGNAHKHAAVVLFGEKNGAEVAFLKHQHFKATSRSVVITQANPQTRTVYEMDGYPAIEAYAAALGLSPQEVTNEITFLHPVLFECDGEMYVRSIQAITEDGAIKFYCAVEEGMVLDIAGHKEMPVALGEAFLPSMRDAEPFDFLLGFHCILRALEAKQKGIESSLGETYRRISRAMVAFDTYGEQLNGLHINQTLVAVSFRGAHQEGCP